MMMYGAHAALEHLLPQGSGKIINIGGPALGGFALRVAVLRGRASRSLALRGPALRGLGFRGPAL
ncbi:hypothetical protein, partial [Actinomadura sp. CNU-125]|uniref:hypothetical protein n=1 Tax=Actinomadura sp. CNU-125 TaxID=1904961 RepID=UPI000B0FBC43